MPYIPDEDDIYQIAFLVSRSWIKYYDNWYKKGMKQKCPEDETRYTKSFSQKEAFETETHGEDFVDYDDSSINVKPRQEPLDSDFNTLIELIKDLKIFAKNNPEHKFICCDYAAGPKGPRLGWSAFIPNVEDENLKLWTITIDNACKSDSNFINMDKPLNRQKMLYLAVAHARGKLNTVDDPLQNLGLVEVRLR